MKFDYLVNLILEDTDPVIEFASMAHEKWRKNWDPEGTGKPRIKKNSDGTEGDINVPFDKLHSDWKRENLAAGEAAKEAVEKFPDDEEAGAEYIHIKWMERNPREEWNADQHVPYEELPDKEKEKEKLQYRIMKSLLDVEEPYDE